MNRLAWGVGVLLPLPGVFLALDLFQGRLGANPVEEVIRQSGLWGLRFTLFTIGLHLLGRLVGWAWCHRLHPVFGMAALAYAVCHLLLFLGLEHLFNFTALVRDVIKRPFITVGMAALLLLSLQGLTTWRPVRRWLGRRFAMAHRLVYLAALAGVVHWLWLVKADWRPPLSHGLVLLALVALRGASQFITIQDSRGKN